MSISLLKQIQIKKKLKNKVINKLKKENYVDFIVMLAAETAKVRPPIGAGIAAVSAGLGISRIGGQAMDAMAPSQKKIGDLRSSMIIAAALVEGVAFFAAIVTLLCYSNHAKRDSN